MEFAPLVDFACSVRSTHNVIIYLTAYTTLPYPQTEGNQSKHFTSCKQQTLRCLCHNYARFDVPTRRGVGVSLSAGILMGHLRCRSGKESGEGASYEYINIAHRTQLIKLY